MLIEVRSYVKKISSGEWNILQVFNLELSPHISQTSGIFLWICIAFYVEKMELKIFYNLLPLPPNPPIMEDILD